MPPTPLTIYFIPHIQHTNTAHPHPPTPHPQIHAMPPQTTHTMHNTYHTYHAHTHNMPPHTTHHALYTCLYIPVPHALTHTYHTQSTTSHSHHMHTYIPHIPLHRLVIREWADRGTSFKFCGLTLVWLSPPNETMCYLSHSLSLSYIACSISASISFNPSWFRVIFISFIFLALPKSTWPWFPASPSKAYLVLWVCSSTLSLALKGFGMFSLEV